MSSTASRGQHEVEGGYCRQCGPCHALRGKCPAFSFHSFDASRHGYKTSLNLFATPTPFFPFALSRRTNKSSGITNGCLVDWPRLRRVRHAYMHSTWIHSTAEIPRAAQFLSQLPQFAGVARTMAY